MWNLEKWCRWSVSHVWLFVTPWTVAHQTALSVEFSSKEYWSGLPFPSPGDLPVPGIKPRSPAFQEDSLPSKPPGKIYTVYKLLWCLPKFLKLSEIHTFLPIDSLKDMAIIKIWQSVLTWQTFATVNCFLPLGNFLHVASKISHSNSDFPSNFY